jgi:hypothetical protein
VIFSTSFVWNIPHFKKNWGRCDKKMYIGLHVKYALVWTDFNQTWIFWKDCFKNIQIRPAVEAELFHANRQTDKTKQIVAFRNFTNPPKKLGQF